MQPSIIMNTKNDTISLVAGRRILTISKNKIITTYKTSELETLARSLMTNCIIRPMLAALYFCLLLIALLRITEEDK